MQLFVLTYDLYCVTKFAKRPIYKLSRRSKSFRFVSYLNIKLWSLKLDACRTPLFVNPVVYILLVHIALKY